MKKIYFTVGPSQTYPKIEKFIIQAIKEEIPSLNHRGSEFKDLFSQTCDNLKKLLNIPKDYQIFFVSSALEGMERTIQSCVKNCSYHIVTGSFGESWADYASELGKKVLRYEFEKIEEISEINLQAPDEAELICITQNDTSTGVWIDPKMIDKIKAKNPKKLIALDLVSSVPYVDINYKNIDVAFFSVQKGFGLPAGLGVIIVSPRALEKTGDIFKQGISIGSYHSFKNLSKKALNFQTPETPNVLNIYLLNKTIQDMLKTGISKIRQETEEKAKIMYELFNSHKIYQLFIKNPKFQSPTTLVLDVKGNSERLRKRFKRGGFIVGAGYGENKLNHIRIANFPSQTLKSVNKLLKII